jgi:hypothetical protein
VVCDSGGSDSRAAVGEALFAWGSSEREVGEVLGGLGVDDDEVGGEWVKPSLTAFGDPPLQGTQGWGHPPSRLGPGCCGLFVASGFRFLIWLRTARRVRLDLKEISHRPKISFSYHFVNESQPVCVNSS